MAKRKYTKWGKKQKDMNAQRKNVSGKEQMMRKVVI